MPKEALPNSVGRGEKPLPRVWEGWLVAIARQVGIDRTTVFRYRTSTFRNVKDAVTVVGAAYLTLTKTMFLSVGTMVVMTPYDCLGDSTTWLFWQLYTVARYTRRFRQAQGTQQRKRRRPISYNHKGE